MQSDVPNIRPALLMRYRDNYYLLLALTIENVERKSLGSCQAYKLRSVCTYKRKGTQSGCPNSLKKMVHPA